MPEPLLPFRERATLAFLSWGSACSSLHPTLLNLSLSGTSPTHEHRRIFLIPISLFPFFTFPLFHVFPLRAQVHLHDHINRLPQCEKDDRQNDSRSDRHQRLRLDRRKNTRSRTNPSQRQILQIIHKTSANSFPRLRRSDVRKGSAFPKASL